MFPKQTYFYAKNVRKKIQILNFQTLSGKNGKFRRKNSRKSSKKKKKRKNGKKKEKERKKKEKNKKNKI